MLHNRRATFLAGTPGYAAIMDDRTALAKSQATELLARDGGLKAVVMGVA